MAKESLQVKKILSATQDQGAFCRSTRMYMVEETQIVIVEDYFAVLLNPEMAHWLCSSLSLDENVSFLAEGQNQTQHCVRFSLGKKCEK